jgi:hypothetical protein
MLGMFMHIQKNADSVMDASRAKERIAYSIRTEMQKIVIGNNASIAFDFYRYKDCSCIMSDET